MATDLTIAVPDDLMKRFQALADGEFRTAEGQLLWLMRNAVDAAARGRALTESHISPEQRRRNMEPVTNELKRLHLLAGKPSSRKLAEDMSRAGSRVSHTTVNGALNGAAPPTWPILERIVTALSGDVEHFRHLWAEANEEQQA